MPIHVTEDTTALVALGIAALKAPTPEIALRMLEGQAAIVDGAAGTRSTTGASPMTEAEADAYWRDALAQADADLVGALTPVKPRTADEGLGRRLSVTEIKPGLVVIARKAIGRFGAWRADGELSAGSLGTVESVCPADGTAIVEFVDIETGERVRGDVYSWEIGLPLAEPRPAYDPWNDMEAA